VLFCSLSQHNKRLSDRDFLNLERPSCSSHRVPGGNEERLWGGRLLDTYKDPYEFIFSSIWREMMGGEDIWRSLLFSRILVLTSQREGHVGGLVGWASAFGWGRDPRVLGLSCLSGSLLSRESPSPSLLPLPLPDHAHTLKYIKSLKKGFF